MIAATKERVYEEVKNALVEALGLDQDDVSHDATLVGDLGAESIDFLDIVFRLEKAFNLKISRDELFPTDLFTDAQYVVDGRLTDSGVAELRRRLPSVNLDKFAEDPLVQEFAQTLTVADLCHFVESKLRTVD